MQNEYYIKEEPIIEKTEMEKETELIRAIIKTREDLKVANCNFEYARRRLSRLLYVSNKSKSSQIRLFN